MVHERLSPYSPTNATSLVLWSEQATIDGAGLGNIAYGVVLALFVVIVPLVWKARQQRPRYAYVTMAYVLALFSCSTIHNFSNVHYIEQQFVDDINFPGGPVMWGIRKKAMVGLVAFVVNTWLQDGVLIYRFFVIFGQNWWLTILPCLGFFASITLSCVTLWGLSHSNETYLSLSNISTSYLAISVGTTVLLTLAIVVKLLRMRHELRSTIGPEHVGPYLSISAMLVESALVYTSIALPHTILLGLRNPAQSITVAVLGHVQTIAPMLIIKRVAEGHAWSHDTMCKATGAIQHISSVNFASMSEAGSSVEPEIHLKAKIDDVLNISPLDLHPQ